MREVKAAYDRMILWIVSVAFAWFVAIFIGLGMRQRMSHNKGVAARGRIRIAKDQKFPAHDFFVAGREFPCRIRHASVTFFDDAMTQVRGVSLKFDDSRFRSPLDLEMNTGEKSIFWSAANFLFFVWNRREKDGIQYKEYYQKRKRGFTGAQVSGRYHPVSFAFMEYHSKTPTLFTSENGDDYYAKYRLIPAHHVIDGAPVPEDRLQKVYDQRVDQDETRSVNYLVNEYKTRVNNGLVSYHLQMQLHRPLKGEGDQIFDSWIAWNDQKHPWMDVAEISVDEILPYEESLKMGFNIGHHPPSLGLIRAKSIHDFNSVVYMRSKTRIAYYVRLLVMKIFGMPAETPESAERNQ